MPGVVANLGSFDPSPFKRGGLRRDVVGLNFFPPKFSDEFQNLRSCQETKKKRELKGSGGDMGVNPKIGGKLPKQMVYK